MFRKTLMHYIYLIYSGNKLILCISVALDTIKHSDICDFLILSLRSGLNKINFIIFII